MNYFLRNCIFICGFILVSIGLSLFGKSSVAGLGRSLFIPPHADYQTYETEHFDLIFPNVYQPEAQRVASVLEETHSLLAPYFEHEPWLRTTVLLTDNQDFANGVASAAGRQGLVLYLTPPDPYSSVGEYDDWLRTLTIHEYTHFLTLGQARGVFAVTRFLFGDLLLPNQFWPRWLSEGMSVYTESYFTTQGRGHGTYFETLTRDALFHGTLGTPQFLEFDQLSGPRPEFPFGVMPYYAGYGIIEQLSRELGDGGPPRFAKEGSYRVPYFLNGGLENIAIPTSSHSFQQLWGRWITHEQERLNPELQWLLSYGSPEPTFISPKGTQTQGARISPDDKLVAYVLQSGYEDRWLYVHDLENNQSHRITRLITGAGLSWSKDSKILYYAKNDFNGRYAFLSDLYSYDLSTQKETRLTRDERAKDPALCGNRLIYTAQIGKLSELRAFDLMTKKVSVLYRAKDYHHVSNPRCFSNGDIVFAEHGREAYDAIYIIKGEQEPRWLVGGPLEGFSALFPEPISKTDYSYVSDKGDSFYFTQAKDGYFSLAKFNLKTKRHQIVCRSSGGYLLPSVGDKKMAVSYLSSRGLQAGILDVADITPLAPSSLQVAPRVNQDARRIRHSSVEHPSFNSQEVAQESSEYKLFTSLAPRFWSPYFFVGTQYRQYGGMITGWDDTDQLSYTVTAYYDSILKKPAGTLETSHRIWKFDLDLFAESKISRVLYFSNSPSLYGVRRSLLASLSLPFPGAFRSLSATVQGGWARTTIGGAYNEILDPNKIASASFTYESRRSFPFSVGTEYGSYLRLAGMRFFSEEVASKFGLQAQHNFPLSFIKNSALSLTGYFAKGTNPTDSNAESFVYIGGTGSPTYLDLPLRGYPQGQFQTNLAGVFQSEFRFPLRQIFSGSSTLPLFLENLAGFAFFDSAKFEENSVAQPLTSSLGGGVFLNTTIGYLLPVQVRIQYAYGLNRDRGGENAVSVGLNL